MNAKARTIQIAATVPLETPTLFQAVRALPRSAWVLFLGIFLNRFGTFVIPFLSLYLTRNGHTKADAGVAIGAYGVGTLLACFIGGYLADHIGRRKTIAFSMVCGAATMLALSQATSWWAVVLLVGLNGLCGEAYRPASSALLADLVPNGQRVIAFAMYRMALNAGWAFGPATAGFVAAHSFFWLFVGDACTSLLFGILAWIALPHGVRSSGQDCGWPIAVRDIARNRAFLQYLAASVLIAWIFYQFSTTYGLFVTELGYSTAVYGALISANGFIVACFELLVSSFARGFAPRRAIACGYVLIAVGFGLNMFVTSIPALALAIVVFTLGEMTSMAIGTAYIADVAPSNMRGRYMGAYGITWSVALIFGPGLGMALLGKSAVLLWTVCGLSAFLGALIISLPLRVNPKR